MSAEQLDDTVRAVEATLFASEEPMSVDALAGHLGGLETSSVREALLNLQGHYEDRGIQLVERGKRWHFETAPDMAHLLRREKEQVRRLSRAATEEQLAETVRAAIAERFGRYNGASLVGLNGIVIKSHGGADIVAYEQAIQTAMIEVEKNVPEKIHQLLIVM